MYCSTCGQELKDNLKFCNNCGARTGRGETQSANSPAGDWSSMSVGWVGFAGFFGFIAVLKLLLGSGLDTTAMVIISLAYLTTVFLTCAVIVGQGWKNKNAGSVKANEPGEYQPPKNFRATPETARLSEYREPASVVENTTRTLDQELVERK